MLYNNARLYKNSEGAINEKDTNNVSPVHSNAANDYHVTKWYEVKKKTKHSFYDGNTNADYRAEFVCGHAIIMHDRTCKLALQYALCFHHKRKPYDCCAEL